MSDVVIGGNKDKQPIGLEAMCWGCSKIWNVSLLPADAKGIKCSCGNYVVTPSGKIMSRPIYDELDSRAPLLEDNYNDTDKPRIILPGEE